MGDAGKDKERNREIAENEAERQTVSDIRVSAWAIAVAVIIGLAVASAGCCSITARARDTGLSMAHA